ncbi:hypothetical protein NUU61_005453 [Penicillium alfredii]|uniref:DUF924-domain-containing protein n=1 Tax=Penicillium alfredii TaxID=1506179 RepID=A0A9W9F9W5_9EURO|nr:uncharacterized protein NUU61_005453 [Penicillium alfredii]KAJ5096097.1 hypothetical protein NUU61_005453 [Penicillium alfredii]
MASVFSPTTMAYLVRTTKTSTSRLTLPALSAWKPISQTSRVVSNRSRAHTIQKPPHQHLRIPGALRAFRSTPTTMASASSLLSQSLTPALLDDVRSFWFDHLDGDASRVLPGQSDMQRWFMRDADFDRACVAQFRSALEAIIESGASATDILNAANPDTPLAWLSLILLLDQIPRNCYRGDEAKLVFTRFDPLAEEIALRAIDTGIPTQCPSVRYRLAYRVWFHMPLMHSESLRVHEKAVEGYEITTRDMEEFIARDVPGLSEDERKCHDVLSSQQEALRAFLTNTFDFEKRHKVIIERFGRYPHRNQALGRKSTPEEIAYLENGGETFGSG